MEKDIIIGNAQVPAHPVNPLELKYLKLLTKIPQMDKALIKSLSDELLTEPSFLKFAVTKQDWNNEEHDGLIKVLEPGKNTNGYYTDKYNQRISYNGIRTLKRAKTEMNLHPLQQAEMDKCKADYKYFRSKYCFIVTKSGLARPEPRHYQEDLEDELVSLEDCAISFSRQSGKTITTATYLLWLALFHDIAINVGIVANKPKTAREVLDKIKKIFVELPIWLMPGIEVWNKSEIEFENGTRIMTDSPSSDSFRGYTINIVYVDECGYIKSSLWDEFTDSIFPTQNSLTFKQTILTSTANGMNHWYQIVKGARNKINGYKLIENDWKEVPHYDKTGAKLDPEIYKDLTIKKYGKKYFAQTEESEFLGSSDTLISTEALKLMQGGKIISKDKIFTDILIYDEPIPGHNYILSVDPAKDGIDSFSIQVIDITKFPFRQVASAKLDVDYLVMPEHLETLGLYYNEAFIIIENNEGAGQSISDMLFLTYEYPNMYRDRDTNDKSYKKFYGFRQTKKTRPLILNMMKIFIEEGKLIVQDQNTINEFFNFIKSDNLSQKFAAEEGYHDDCVMSLAIAFAPFMHVKAFDDLELFLSALHIDVIDGQEVETAEYYSLLDVGGFSDGNSEYDNSREAILDKINNTFDEDEKFTSIRELNNMNHYN